MPTYASLQLGRTSTGPRVLHSVVVIDGLPHAVLTSRTFSERNQPGDEVQLVPFAQVVPAADEPPAAVDPARVASLAQQKDAKRSSLT